METATTSLGTVGKSEPAGLSFVERKLVALCAIVVLLLAGSVATAPPASAGYCGHEDHEHWHNLHKDYYHFHGHYQDAGVHYHNWHNHTHGNLFYDVC